MPGTTQEDLVFECRDLELGYGRKTILRGVDMTARKGICLGILGPNGSGKTTILRALLGSIKPLRGYIRWGRNGEGQPLRLGYVPQGERLDAAFPLTAFEVVRMGTFADSPWSPFLRAQQKQRVAQALERVHMLDKKGLLFSECSGGQRQRLLIARALVSNPQVMILDEPTTGIDPSAQRDVTRLLSELRGEHRITLLIVTQHFGHLEALFEEVAWVYNGGVRMGPAKDFLTDEYLSQAFGKA